MLTIHYGPDAAKGIGDAHEYGEDGNPDSVVDQFNNPIGRAIGGSVRGNEDIPCSERPKAVVADCTRAIRDGTLAVSPADPRLGLPGVGGTPPDSSSGDHLVLGTHPVLGIHQAEGLHNDVGLNCASKDLQLACLRGTLIRARVLELV
jgi:hypothetical protein